VGHVLLHVGKKLYLSFSWILTIARGKECESSASNDPQNLMQLDLDRARTEGVVILNGAPSSIYGRSNLVIEIIVQATNSKTLEALSETSGTPERRSRSPKRWLRLRLSAWELDLDGNHLELPLATLSQSLDRMSRDHELLRDTDRRDSEYC
jgi:hypothetical protein